MPAALFAVLALAGAMALIPVLARRRAAARAPADSYVPDPARDARAELRARELLGSVAGAEALAMYDQLGFVAVERGKGYGYLLYPHRPIVAHEAGNGELLSEYCVRFPDAEGSDAGRWLPDADDVLAKWMALHGDEQQLIASANMHLPGRQLDPAMVRRDLARLESWRSRRGDAVAASGTPAGKAEEVAASGTPAGAPEEVAVK